jgi:hypothetical protein
VYIFPTIVAANEMEVIFSLSGLQRSFRRSIVGLAGVRGTMRAAGPCVAATLAARSSGVPFFDRRGFRENAPRVTL